MSRLSNRTYQIAPSKTVEISNIAMQLKQKGIDIISFSAGEPDFDTPAFIKDAACLAIKDGITKYTPVRGLSPLIEAIRNKLKRDNSLVFTHDQIIVTTGAKQAIALALDAIVDGGDEVIIPAPYWVSYPDMVKLSGGIPVIMDTSRENGYKLTPDMLDQAITKDTKAVILNSPTNPTGAVYSKEEVAKLSSVCVKHEIYIISDEIYEHIIFDESHHSIARSSDNAKKLTILINGCSKAYAMTGWRVGYAAAEADIVGAMAKIMSQRTTNVCSISQMAAVAALNGDHKVVDTMVAEYRKRRDYMVEGLNGLGIACTLPQATFYVFPDIAPLLKKRYKQGIIKTANRFCMLLLKEAKVAAVPGEPFGNPANIRLSFATSRNNIDEGLKRIKDFLSELDG